MTKFFKNLYRLILIGTPLFIISNYIRNFLPNYKTKKKSKKIENDIYENFKSINYKEKKQEFLLMIVESLREVIGHMML